MAQIEPRFGIEAISVFGMPPVEYVNLAADLGCQCISTGLVSVPFSRLGYPPFSLRDDPALRAAMIEAMHERGVVVSLAEGLNFRPTTEASDFERDLDIFVELGAERINTVSMDPDLPRTLDQFAKLAELAGARGLQTTTEFAPSLTIATLSIALDAVRHVGRSDFKLLIDTMHLVRSGSTAADLAAVDPALIGYVQLSDAPRAPRFDSYFEESMFERLPPGQGQLGLDEVVAALPKDLVFSVEVPMREEALAGVSAHERLGACVEGARRLVLGSSAA